MSEHTISSTPFILTHAFDAPRGLVFKAWSEAEHLAKWWGPKGFSLNVIELEFKQGGIFHYNIEAGGNTMWGRFMYIEIVEPERIVFVNSFSDPERGITRAPFNESWPLVILNTLTLDEQNGKTVLTISGGPIDATPEERSTFESMFDSMQQGFTGTFEQLEAYLETAQQSSFKTKELQ